MDRALGHGPTADDGRSRGRSPNSLLGKGSPDAASNRGLIGGKLPKIGVSEGAAMDRVVKRREIRRRIEDDGLEFLLPSNGGYNPKEATEFVEEVEEREGTAPLDSPVSEFESVGRPPSTRQSGLPQPERKPKSTLAYAKMLRRNIA